MDLPFGTCFGDSASGVKYSFNLFGIVRCRFGAGLGGVSLSSFPSLGSYSDSLSEERSSCSTVEDNAFLGIPFDV